MRKTALTIAGSDCSGGAGIQADIKTMMANGVYAMSAITAMTAQNTTGVAAVQESSPKFLTQQLDCVFTDIYPDAVKVGMVSSAELIRVIADRLSYYGAKNIVVDPVMVSTSGSELLDPAALDALKSSLFPLADLLTPNIPEAEVLTGRRISTAEQMQAAAVSIGETYGCSVFVKGGHSMQAADDVLYSRFRDGYRPESGHGLRGVDDVQYSRFREGCRPESGHGLRGVDDVQYSRFRDGCRPEGGHSLQAADDVPYHPDTCGTEENGDGSRGSGAPAAAGILWFHGTRIDNPNTHGTGCTLSAAIAANLAKGFDMETSIRLAKEYLTGALSAMLDLGAGSGPMDHGFFPVWETASPA